MWKGIYNWNSSSWLVNMLCWEGKEVQKVEQREENLDKRQGRDVYKYTGQVISLKISMATFLFFIVCSLPDLGGQGIRLCYYSQSSVITGNWLCYMYVAKHVWSQWDCLNFTEDFSLIKDLKGIVHSKGKPGRSWGALHIESISLSIRCDCATLLDVSENFVLWADLQDHQWDSVSLQCHTQQSNKAISSIADLRTMWTIL